MDEEIARLRAVLVLVQKAEPHHGKIGSAPIDEVCRRCPSKNRCKRASVALADAETKKL